MSRLRKWLMIATAALLLLILGAAIVAARGPKKKLQEAKLNDGRIVQVAGVTVGPPHSIHAPGIRNVLYHFAPEGLKRRMGPNFNSGFGFNYEGIGLWLMCYDPALEKYVPSPFSKVVIVDDHGCEMESTGMGSTSDGFHQASVLHISNFPREREKLTFKIYGLFGKSNVLGEITVDNPVTAKRADWSARELPMTVTNGNLVAKLNRLRTAEIENDLEIFVNGAPSKDWTQERMSFEDPLGNEAGDGQNLCREEKAWKLKTVFMRTPFASFTSNEVWKVGPIRMPAAGASMRLELTNLMGALPLKVQCISGPGSYTYSNGVCISSAPWTNGMSDAFWVTGTRKQGKHIPITTRASEDVTIVVEHESLYPKRQFMARFWRAGEVVAAARGASGDGTCYYYDLSWLVAPQDIPGTNALLEMEIIVQEGREFDFMVNPKDYQPAKAEVVM